MAHIKELPNGKYRVFWRENACDEFGAPIKGEYSQRCETLDTAKEAERYRVNIEEQLDSRLRAPSAKRDKAAEPLGEYAKRYFEVNESRIAESTLNGYRDIYRRHVADTFGSRPVGSILPSDVSAWFSALLQGDSNRYVDNTAQELELAKRNPKTAKHALGVLRRILNVAVADDAVTANPALVKLNTSNKAKKARRRKFKHTPLTPPQIAALADYIANEKGLAIYGLVVLFDGFTGPRAAEIAGLEIRDITLSDIAGTAGQVHVERTKTKRGGVWVTEPPKTDESERVIPIEPWLADDLRAYLREHPKANEPNAPLFPGRLDLAAAKAQGRNVKETTDRYDWTEPIDCGNFYKRFMQPGEKALGLPAARFHDLRHSYAVNLLSANPPVDFKRVSKWLGHSTFTLTLDTYGDYINEDISQPAGLTRPIAAQTNVVPLHRNG